MSYLAPGAICLPFLAAAVLVGASSRLRRPWADLVSVMAAAGVTVMCAILLAGSGGGLAVTWFGGWVPRGGVALGISLTVEPLGAGLATLAAALTTAVFVFSFHYFDTDEPLFHSLTLVFLAGMVGFCLSGDLFNMFVFFEIMSVASYVLVGFETEETAPLSGALNFAVTNSVGASMIVSGIALLYGRTGALNLAQIGRALEHAPADGLVVVAFLLIVTGFLVKAAVVPFHFWLADAYSVAPVPFCAVLAGAVSELGLFAVARVYWTVFDGPLGPHATGVGGILLTVGVLTALVGALMCFAQRHLKRLLAFATVSHMGLFLVGIALLNPVGLAGTSLFVVADGCVKAALFLCVGVLQHRCGTVDEPHLRGQGRGIPLIGVTFMMGGLAMASLPLVGPFLGKALIEEGADAAGYGWLTVPMVLASALTSGAVLRATARIWLGWGPDEKAEGQRTKGDEEPVETGGRPGHKHKSMLVPSVTLMVVGLVLGLIPGLGPAAVTAATRFQDRDAYTAMVLDGSPAPAIEAHAPELGTSPVLYTLLSLAVGVGLALATLFRHRLPAPLGGRPAPPLGLRAVTGLRALHSGHVGDYVAWLTTGAAAIGVALALVVMR